MNWGSVGKLYHDCTINHTGSAGSMEAASVINIFKRSVETKKLRYTTYLGDGDSKSFKDIVESNIYPGHEVGKHECIGHVQKRVAYRLRTYKSDYKSTLLSDHKKLPGAGRLTNKVMNTLQNYYRMVIRSNVGNLYQMKKGIAAIIHHCSEYLVKVDDSDKKVCDDDAHHKFCPEGLESWCKYQKQKVAGEITYKPKIKIPEAVRDVIKPIFSYEDLAADDLLKKCLHGQNQNANEAFNNCIWRKAPKDTFVARRTLEVAVVSAVIHFNEGGNGMLQVFNNCGIAPGHFTIQGYAKFDQARIKLTNRKATPKCKQDRKRKSVEERLAGQRKH